MNTAKLLSQAVAGWIFLSAPMAIFLFWITLFLFGFAAPKAVVIGVAVFSLSVPLLCLFVYACIGVFQRRTP